MSQREPGELLGATQKTVDYYERRTLNPTLDVIQKVAEALEVSPAQLIGDSDGLMKTSRKTGPTSKVQKVFEVVSSPHAASKRKSSTWSPPSSGK